MKLDTKTFMDRYSRFGVLILIMIVLSIISPKSFLTWDNISTLLFQQTPVAVLMGFGMTLSIITLGIDVSMGSTLVLSSVVSANFIKSGQIGLGLAVALLIGILVGWMNGILITKVGLHPFIATYGTNSIALGLAYVYTGGIYIYDFPQSFRNISNGTFLGIPNIAVIAIVIFAVLYFVTQRTSFGRSLYSCGFNYKATILCGINAAGVITAIYIVNGLLSSTAGILYMARLNAADPGISGDFTMDSIAAVLIGGTSFSGGKGSVARTVIGALIIVFIRNGMNILNISTTWQQTVVGVIILLSVIIEGLTQKLIVPKRGDKFCKSN